VRRLIFQNLAAGSHPLAIGLPAAYRARLKHKHRLSMVLKLVVTGSSGERAAASRQVLLVG
jgi:hypothetical protein